MTTFVVQRYHKVMISLKQIKQVAKQGDYMRVAEICCCSVKNVRAVIDQKRSDNYHIQYAFYHLLKDREKLKTKIQSLQKTKNDGQK